MQNQVANEPSKAVKRALVSSVVVLVYELFILLVGVVLSVTEIHHCARQDMGACAMQNMFVDFLGFILAFIFNLIVPLLWFAANGISIAGNWGQQGGRKNLLIGSLVSNVLALVFFVLFWLVVGLYFGF